GITNQRETAVVWDRKTGKPVYNAILWQCRRTSEICRELKAAGYEDHIRETTGLKADAYFSGPKIKWILDNVPGARGSASAGDLLFGTIDTWLVYKFTSGKYHVTDYTNASRTMLFDIHDLCWDKKMLDILEIPESMLPKVLPCGGDFGYVSYGGTDIPIRGIAGDQQAALFGELCTEFGDIKITYGTGCFMLANTGGSVPRSEHGLLATVAVCFEQDKPQYALEGSVFTGGSLVKWLRDSLGIIATAPETESLARSVDSNGGVYIVPAFTGLGAPYWDMDARGTVLGITGNTTRAHVARAALESIAFQTDELLVSMEKDLGIVFRSLLADGGASNNGYLLEFQAGISGIPVVRTGYTEATALGAALIAGLSTGFYDSLESIREILPCGRCFEPAMDEEKRKSLLESFASAVSACRSFRGINC
ncbi:MAG: glycerol kinase, partial [Clostridia bacterium]|nr:glycerol kinase [Clostridia bacterium]